MVGARARGPKARWSLRLSLLMVTCAFSISAPRVFAAGCSSPMIAYPSFSDTAARSAVFRRYTEIAGQTDLVSNLSPSTLSRLAVLSDPFQSFQESRVAADPNCDSWGGRDKVRHAAIFFATTLGLQLFIESTFNTSRTKAFLISAAIGTLVGVGREFYDWKISDKDCFSEQDLVANTAGILSAGLVIMITN